MSYHLQSGISVGNVQDTSENIAELTENNDVITANDVTLIAEAVGLIVAENNGNVNVSLWQEFTNMGWKIGGLNLFHGLK